MTNNLFAKYLEVDHLVEEEEGYGMVIESIEVLADVFDLGELESTD